MPPSSRPSAPQPVRGQAAHTFIVWLAYPDEGRTHAVRWTLTLSGPGPQGAVLRRWSGTQQVGAGGKSVNLPWDGRADADARERRALVPDGLYQLRLLAVADAGTPQEAQVEQQWHIQVQRGASTAPRVPAFQAGLQQLPGLDGQVDYRIVYANLHSQTRHSDGGAALDACHGAQDPQTAPYGPIDAYQYAQQHGLDALLTSEHNHMYDGSDGTNAAATAAEATRPCTRRGWPKRPPTRLPTPASSPCTAWNGASSTRVAT